MQPPRLQRLFAVPPFFLLLGNLALADAITGRVVDVNGEGVAGVDIDFIPLGSGGNPHELNDGTDALGNFLTTVDPGVYEIRFYPPSPPASVLLTGVVTPVTVVGTKNMGTITLTAGVLLKGKTVNPANQPVSGVRADVFDAITKAQLPVKNNTTNAFGIFQLAVPTQELELELFTSGVVGQTLVPRAMALTPTGTTDLGNVNLQSGFHVTGTVHRSTGTGIANADVDIIDPVTDLKIFTPGDNTNVSGIFDVVLAAGVYDVMVCRPGTPLLVAVDTNNVSVTGPTDVGILVMQNGVLLSGTVTDRKGRPIVAADVNVFEEATGHSITLCGDNTDAGGHYAVVVPTGLSDVVFSPPWPHAVWDKDIHLGVNITGNTSVVGTLEVSLQRDSRPLDGGVLSPLLIGSGVPAQDGRVPQVRWVPHMPGIAGSVLQLSQGKANGTGLLMLGPSVTELPSLGLHTVAPPRTYFRIALDGSGAATFELPAAPVGLIGQAGFAQLLVLDRLDDGDVASSPVLRYPFMN